MKLKFKVVLIQQRTVPKNGGTAVDTVTFIKLQQEGTASDVLLHFNDAEIEWAPEKRVDLPDGRYRIELRKETLIQSAKVKVDGEELTFLHEGEYVFDVAVAPAAAPVVPVQSPKK